MEHLNTFRLRKAGLAEVCVALVGHAHAQQFDPAEAAGLHGGLVGRLVIILAAMTGLRQLQAMKAFFGFVLNLVFVSLGCTTLLGQRPVKTNGGKE